LLATACGGLSGGIGSETIVVILDGVKNNIQMEFAILTVDIKT
jgi:hypothetical protein